MGGALRGSALEWAHAGIVPLVCGRRATSRGFRTSRGSRPNAGRSSFGASSRRTRGTGGRRPAPATPRAARAPAAPAPRALRAARGCARRNGPSPRPAPRGRGTRGTRPPTSRRSAAPRESRPGITAQESGTRPGLDRLRKEGHPARGAVPRELTASGSSTPGRPAPNGPTTAPPHLRPTRNGTPGHPAPILTHRSGRPPRPNAAKAVAYFPSDKGHPIRISTSAASPPGLGPLAPPGEPMNPPLLRSGFPASRYP